MKSDLIELWITPLDYAGADSREVFKSLLDRSSRSCRRRRKPSKGRPLTRAVNLTVRLRVFVLAYISILEC